MPLGLDVLRHCQRGPNMDGRQGTPIREHLTPVLYVQWSFMKVVEASLNLESVVQSTSRRIVSVWTCYGRHLLEYISFSNMFRVYFLHSVTSCERVQVSLNARFFKRRCRSDGRGMATIKFMLPAFTMDHNIQIDVSTFRSILWICPKFVWR